MKPIKTTGNFVVYEGEARRAAFALESDARFFEECEDLLAAAKEVLYCWGRGDLAAAVRDLSEVVNRIDSAMEDTNGDGPVQESEKGGD